MKKIIKLPIESTTQIRKTEDSLCELYSHDKNNGLFEFEVTNVKLGNEKPYAMFKFMDSMSVWKVLGTIEDNKIKVAFDTTLITQDETVVCFLYLDDEERTTDFYRFKFKVKVSEIDKLDTYAVKERYFNKSIIVDKVDVVTKKELEEALKGLTVTSVEGLLTETRADELYAKKSEIYDDTALSNRVKALEERPDNNTVYDDTDLRGRVVALESKADNDTVYDDADLKRRVSELENKSDKDTVYDDSDLRGRVEALENKPDNNTVYDDTILTNRVKALEDRPTGSSYDDSDLQGRVRALEERPSTTAYDDTDVKQRLTNLEGRPDNNTVYDDTDLKRRVSDLEQRPDNNTVYDDTALSGRVKALEDAPKVDVTNFATKDDVVAFNRELNNKVSSVDFEAFKTTIPAPYNDSDLRSRVETLETKQDKDTVYDDEPIKSRLTALENKPFDDYLTNEELEKHKFVTKEQLDEATELDYSNIVTTDELKDYAKKTDLPVPYNDKVLSDRVLALENKPSTGGGAQTKDTGWITISEEDPLNGNIVRIRRVNDMVYVSLNNPDTDNAHLQLEVTDGHGAVLAEKEIQKGFTPMRTVIVPVISNIETIMLSTDLNKTGQAVFNVVNNRVTLKAYDKDITSGIPTSKHINDFSYFTEDPFPTNLH